MLGLLHGWLPPRFPVLLAHHEEFLAIPAEAEVLMGSCPMEFAYFDERLWKCVGAPRRRGPRDGRVVTPGNICRRSQMQLICWFCLNSKSNTPEAGRLMQSLAPRPQAILMLIGGCRQTSKRTFHVGE